jgi:predicted ArsR family transcriptional regulator
MAESIKTRQQQILKLLLENKLGLSIDEIASSLHISRNAVQQHFTVLEKDGYIKAGALNKTAGRPVRSFVLTEAGINSFPKQYAWLSELILIDLKNQLGPEELRRYLHKLGSNLSKGMLPQFIGKHLDDRLDALLGVMDNLGFDARRASPLESNEPIIEAYNCIYHDLAQKHEEICEFDTTLISALLEKNIEHEECMAKGGLVCRFKVLNH